MTHDDHQSSALRPGKGHFQVAHEWLTGRVEDPRRLDPLLEDLVALSYADLAVQLAGFSMMWVGTAVDACRQGIYATVPDALGASRAAAMAEAAGLGDEWIGSANRLVDAAARQDSETASEVVSEIAQRSNAFVVGIVGFIVAGQRMLLEANAVCRLPG